LVANAPQCRGGYPKRREWDGSVFSGAADCFNDGGIMPLLCGMALSVLLARQ